MKKEHVIGLCLITGIVCVSIMAVLLLSLSTDQKNTSKESLSDLPASTSGGVLGGQSSHNIALDTAMTKVPDQVIVYKTMPTVITKADAIELAKKFGVTNINEPKEGDAVISVSSMDMRYNIMLYKNGGSRYSDYHRIDNPNGIDIGENLPSDEEALKIATAFLKERDLLPNEAFFSSSKHRTATTRYSNGTQIVSWEDILLGYSRELNGMNVEGTQFMVEVGAYGDIISYFVNWKEYQPVGEYPIKSGESAFAELKQKGISVDGGPEKPDIISINQAYLAYHTKALAYPEYFLEPVWVFKGTALADGKSVAPITEFIPALTDEAMKSLSS